MVDRHEYWSCYESTRDFRGQTSELASLLGGRFCRKHVAKMIRVNFTKGTPAICFQVREVNHLVVLSFKDSEWPDDLASGFEVEESPGNNFYGRMRFSLFFLMHIIAH